MLEAFLGEPQHRENLTIFPILAEEDRTLPYVLMADALATGFLTIGEKDGGQVPILLAENQGGDPILIVDGEQLIGARQNRMTNRSILLAPKTTTEISVSCMEQGRWHFVGDQFSAAPQHAPSKVRRKARETEEAASRAADARGPGVRASYRDLAAAQGEVWDEIQDLGDKLGGASATGALDAIYGKRQQEMEDWQTAFPLLPRQVGLLAFTGPIPLGLDALGSPSLFAKLHQRFLTGYVLDALEQGAGRGRRADRVRPGAPEPTGMAEAEAFVESMRRAERAPSEPVGMGEYRILRGTALGGELVNDDHLVHLSAFPTVEDRQSRGGRNQANSNGPNRPSARPSAGPIARPSRRRRRF